MRRVDFGEEVRREKLQERQKRAFNVVFRFRMGLINMYYGMSVENVARKVGVFLKLYHDSLQGLVQGYREVTMDAKGEFRFDKDGRTVKEKMDSLESKLNEYSKGVSFEKKND
mmetsp:Transcript_13882/g.13514  ORF Transcript_13882/g.13514 Transcript_13882/m.13514 type:complete len:113 (+) Transcript_13882:164-502(+)